MKRASHHFHVVLDETGSPTLALLEHEHQVNPGRRHIHVRRYDQVLEGLVAQGVEPASARLRAMRIDGYPETTYSFDRPPGPPEETEAEIARKLHPEVRRLLT